MSNVSNRHAMVPFTAGESKAFSGQRLARVGYKATKANPTPPASVCVSVPPVAVADIRENLDALLPHIVTLVEGAQDGIIRSLYESAGHVCRDISDDDINMSAVIGYLNAQADGDRITADRIGAWFDSQVAENLTVVIAEKLGYADLTPDNLPTVEKHVKVYRDLLGMLAGGKTILTPKQITGCRTAIALAGSDDLMGERLVSRLDRMAAKAADDLLLI